MTAGTHPRHDLDALLVHAVHFSIVAALVGVDKAEFALVRDSIEITDPGLSKQVATLEEAGYLDVEKGRVGRKPRTWLILTEAGEAAYRQHLVSCTFNSFKRSSEGGEDLFG